MSGSHLALVVDDTRLVAEDVEGILELMGHRCVIAANQHEAQQLLEGRSFCFVLLDLELPARSNRLPKLQTGFNVLEWIRERYSPQELPVIMMTAHGTDHHYGIQAMKRGANDFIKKPFDEEAEPMEDKIRQVLAAGCEALPGGCPRGGAAPGDAPAAAPRPEPRPASKKRGTRKAPVFHLVGFVKKRRYMVEVNGKEVWLRLTSFECLARLVAGVLHRPTPGWLDVLDLADDSRTAHRYISRLKEDLAKAVDTDRCIVNDGHGKYRLSVAADRLSFAVTVLRSDHPELIALLQA